MRDDDIGRFLFPSLSLSVVCADRGRLLAPVPTAPTSAPTSPRSETSRSLEQSFDRSLARSTRETEEEIETRVRERYESKFRDLEAHAETLRARCESLDERLARDSLALLDAAGALETRARLVSTLRSRIESLEDREHEHRKFSGERVAIGTTTRSSVLAFAA